MQKKLLIITPVYNTELYLVDFIESVLSQSFTDFDLFLVDDGSTDRSLEILKNYAKLDNRLKVFHKQNGGVSSARNYALSQAYNLETKYEYIYFCDSDDLLGKDMLSNVLLEAAKHDIDYAVFSVAYLYKSGIKCSRLKCPKNKKLTKNDIIKQYFRYGLRWKKLPSSEGFLNNKLFKYSLLENIYFDERLSRAEDFDLFFRLIPKLNNGILVNDAWYIYRRRKSSLTNTIEETGDFLVYLKNKEELSTRSDIEKKTMQHKFIRAIYTGCCNAICNRNYERYQMLKNVIGDVDLNYRFGFSDIKMLILLMMPVNLFSFFATYRFNKRKNSQTYEFFD